MSQPVAGIGRRRNVGIKETKKPRNSLPRGQRARVTRGKYKGHEVTVITARPNSPIATVRKRGKNIAVKKTRYDPKESKLKEVVSRQITRSTMLRINRKHLRPL